MKNKSSEDITMRYRYGTLSKEFGKNEGVREEVGYGDIHASND